MLFGISRRWPFLKHVKPLSHTTALHRLCHMGWQPNVVYDIGAFRGNWSRSVKAIFPTSEFVLFEANEDNELYLKNSGFRYFMGALAAKDDDERVFYTQHNTVATGASLYRENTSFYADENLVVRKIKTMRLDSIIVRNKLSYPNLIKIDVQGAELDVLAGAESALEFCEVLIVELSLLNYNKDAPLFDDVVKAVSRLGLKCVDICEIHRVGRGFLLQMDLLFVRPSLYEKYHSAAGLA